MDGLRESLERLMDDGALTPSFSDLDDLSIHAQTFKTQATTTRRKFWWKNKKVRLLFSHLFHHPLLLYIFCLI